MLQKLAYRCKAMDTHPELNPRKIFLGRCGHYMNVTYTSKLGGMSTGVFARFVNRCLNYLLMIKTMIFIFLKCN